MNVRISATTQITRQAANLRVSFCTSFKMASWTKRTPHREETGKTQTSGAFVYNHSTSALATTPVVMAMGITVLPIT